MRNTKCVIIYLEIVDIEVTYVEGPGNKHRAAWAKEAKFIPFADWWRSMNGLKY